MAGLYFLSFPGVSGPVSMMNCPEHGHQKPCSRSWRSGYVLNCISQNSYVETPTPNVTVFGDGDFREVIQVK